MSGGEAWRVGRCFVEVLGEVLDLEIMDDDAGDAAGDADWKEFEGRISRHVYNTMMQHRDI